MTTGRINQVTFLEQPEQAESLCVLRHKLSKPTGASLGTRTLQKQVEVRRVCCKFPRIEKKLYNRGDALRLNSEVVSLALPDRLNLWSLLYFS